MRRTVVVLGSRSSRHARCEQCWYKLHQGTERMSEFGCVLPRAFTKVLSVPESEVVVACTCDKGSTPCFDKIASKVKRLRIEAGSTLSAWLRECFLRLCEPDKAVVAVRGDAPEPPALCIELAFDVLSSNSADIILGCSRLNGAICMLGMSAYHSQLFDGIDWNKPCALSKAIECSAKLGLRWYVLPRWSSTLTSVPMISDTQGNS